MSATEKPDDKKNPAAQSDPTPQEPQATAAPPTGKVDSKSNDGTAAAKTDNPKAGATKTDAATSREKTPPHGKSGQKTTAKKTTASSGANPSPSKPLRGAPEDRTAPPISSGGPKRFGRTGLVAAVIVLLLLAGPALFALCLNQPQKPTILSAEPNGAAIACDAVAGHFTDCYLSEELTVSIPAPPEKSGFEALCCDFVLERMLSLQASYKDARGDIPATLASAPAEIALEDGARLSGSPVLHRDTAPLSRTLQISGRPTYSMPLLVWLEARTNRDIGVDLEALVGRVSPKALRDVSAEESLAIGENGTTVRLLSGGTEIGQVSIRARTVPSLLFGDFARSRSEYASILERADGLPAQTSGWLARKIDTMSPASHGALRAQLSALSGISIDRAAPEADATGTGATCIAFYETMRRHFSRYDAAVATYIAARPTGLLGALSADNLHGCKDSGQPGKSADLAADWQALNAPFEDLLPPPAEVETPTTASASDKAVTRLLLDIASAGKSGARLSDVKAAMNDPVAIRFGRRGDRVTADRADILRVLHRQWSHIGCWIYAPTGTGGGTAMLLAEAQYPYLNRFVIGLNKTGQIGTLEITGVTFDDILRFKAANRGRECQDFLNRVRLAEYRDWYAGNPAGTPTPADHAERLFREGLQQKFRLN